MHQHSELIMHLEGGTEKVLLDLCGVSGLWASDAGTQTRVQCLFACSLDQPGHLQQSSVSILP
jgi:hypothetical protein